MVKLNQNFLHYSLFQLKRIIDDFTLFYIILDNAADFKQLRGGVEIVDAIPKTPSGKILRRQLKR